MCWFSLVMVPPHGVEPRTYWLQINCSCRLLRWPAILIHHSRVKVNNLGTLLAQHGGEYGYNFLEMNMTLINKIKESLNLKFFSPYKRKYYTLLVKTIRSFWYYHTLNILKIYIIVSIFFIISDELGGKTSFFEWCPDVLFRRPIKSILQFVNLFILAEIIDGNPST